MNTVAIDISRAKAIDGWMTEPELVWLAEQAVEHRCIVEIGSYLGRSTRALLDHTAGIVYAIDDWKGPRDVDMTTEERKDIFAKFISNVEASKHMKWKIEEGKLHIIVTNHANLQDYWELWTMELNEGIRHAIPDMVFIDGSHEYADVKRDIEFWQTKIVKGGLLCGHDAGVFPGVDRAVMEVLGDVDVADTTSIWYKII